MHRVVAKIRDITRDDNTLLSTTPQLMDCAVMNCVIDSLRIIPKAPVVPRCAYRNSWYNMFVHSIKILFDILQSAGHHCYGMKGDSRHDDLSPLPGPCAHCCGCTDDNRAHRHGDSCRAHHNQAKYGRSQGSSRGKNPRGLSIRPSKQAQQQSIAPPLSPISEVSSVTSSMMSLPITSANSQTSLLKQKSRKQTKNSDSKISDIVTSESEVESTSESNANRASSKISPKVPCSGHKGQKLDAGHFASGPFGACYDSGYATSNYEDDTSSIVKSDDVTNNIKSNDLAMNSWRREISSIDPLPAEGMELWRRQSSGDTKGSLPSVLVNKNKRNNKMKQVFKQFSIPTCRILGKKMKISLHIQRSS